MPRLMIRFEINMMTKLSFLKSFDYISQPHHLVTENFLCEFLQLQLRGGAVVLVGTFQLLMQGAWTSLVGLVEACVDNRLMHDRSVLWQAGKYRRPSKFSVLRSSYMRRFLSSAADDCNLMEVSQAGKIQGLG